MNLFGMLDLSSSALHAQRIRAEVVAANMANAETTRTADGGAYRRQSVVFETAGGGFSQTLHAAGGYIEQPLLGGRTAHVPEGGVQIADVIQSDAPALQRYDPSHPDADANGYVSYPDINPVTEMVDLMSASRSYGLNAGALQAEKGMLSASLDLLK